MEGNKLFQLLVVCLKVFFIIHCFDTVICAIGSASDIFSALVQFIGLLGMLLFLSKNAQAISGVFLSVFGRPA